MNSMTDCYFGIDPDLTLCPSCGEPMEEDYYSLTCPYCGYIIETRNEGGE